MSQRQPVSDEPCITAKEVAARLATPLATFYDWRQHGYGPRGYHVRGRLLYRWSEVEAWLQQHREPDPAETVVRPLRTQGSAASGRRTTRRPVPA